MNSSDVESVEDDLDEISNDATLSYLESSEDGEFEFSSKVSSAKEKEFCARNGIKWSKEPLKGNLPGVFDDKIHGLTQESEDAASAKDIFHLFFSNNMLEQMVKYTNLQAKKATKSKRNRWKCVTVEEMRAFLAVLIAAGRLHQNDLSVSVMWDSDDLWSAQFYKIVMSRERFQAIYNHWRFDDRSTRKRRFRKSKDKMEPIKTIYNELVERCIRMYNPGKNLTVDERLCVYRGHVPFRVYMPSKPGKYGIKVWCCACIDCQYISNFQVYTGKKAEKPEKGLGMRVVKELVEPFTNEWREITTDNFFTSLDLANYLWEKKTILTGTMRNNRKELPQEFTTVKGRQADSVLEGTHGISSLTSYVDGKKKKPVVILTTNRIKAKKKDKKPAVVLHYNSTKGAVDTGDFITRKTNCVRKTQVWTKKLAMEFLSIACLNASCIFRLKYPEYYKGNCRWRSLFLKDLCYELVADHVEIRSSDKFLAVSLRESMKSFLTKPLRQYYCGSNKCSTCLLTKITYICSVCSKKYCSDHGSSVSVTICRKCDAKPSSVPSLLAPSMKRKRCECCKSDRKTRMKCAKCQLFVCSKCGKDVSVLICEMCKV